MKKYLLISAALFLLGTPFAAHAASGIQQTQQVVTFGGIDPVTGAQSWMPQCNVLNNGARANTIPSIACIIPSAGILSGLIANASSTPGGTASWRIFFYKNGAITPMSCDITSAITQCTNATTTIAMAAGDVIEFSDLPANTPNHATLSASMLFTPLASGDTFIAGGHDTVAPSATLENYHALAYYRYAWNATSGSTTGQTIFPDTGSITGLYYNNGGSLAGSGKTDQIGVLQNNATTTVTCTVDNTGNPTAGKCNDTSHSFSVLAGDYLDIFSFPTGTPTTNNQAHSLKYVSNTPGNFVFFGGNSTSGAGPSWAPFAGSSGNAGAGVIEPYIQMVSKAMTVTGFSVSCDVTPGSSHTRIITLRRNAADTPLTCTMSATSKTCVATGRVPVYDGDLIDYAYGGSNPTAGFCEVNAVANLQPVGPIVVTDTTATTWTVPADWTNTNTIECIGAGGNGANGSGLGSTPGAGGGGGSYAEALNQRLTPGSTVTIALATGGSGSDTLIKDNGGSNIIDCSAGANASTITGGSGGTSTGGSVQNAGGNGGNATNSSRRGGGGGGGAAGRTGVGQNGGAGGGSLSSGGGGGGGSAGSSATAGSAGAATNGGNGGVGTGGTVTSAGAAGTSAVNANDGQLGAGGGGGATTAGHATGANGGTDGATYGTVVYGSGGGGGGGGSNTTTAGNGGKGGTFGGGGGGAGTGGTSDGVGGTGGQGILIITYAHRAMVQVRGGLTRIKGGKVRIQ